MKKTSTLVIAWLITMVIVVFLYYLILKSNMEIQWKIVLLLLVGIPRVRIRDAFDQDDY